MQYSFVALAALATAVAAKPAFTNSAWDVVEGVPFTLTFSGCSAGCTIFLKNGKSGDLKVVDTIVADVTDEFTWTPSDLPSDTYAFTIVDSKGVENFSSQWEYKGTGEAKKTKTKAPETTTEAPTATSEAAETTSTTTLKTSKTKSIKTTISTNSTTPASTPAPTTSEAAETSSDEAKPTETNDDDDEPAPTTVPDSAAIRATSSLALIAGAMMAFAFLN